MRAPKKSEIIHNREFEEVLEEHQDEEILFSRHKLFKHPPIFGNRNCFEKRPLIRSRQIDGSLFPNRDRANRIKTKIMKKVFDERKSLAKRFFTSESGQSFLDSLKGHVADLCKYDVKDAAIIIKKIITGLSKNVKSNRAKKKWKFNTDKILPKSAKSPSDVDSIIKIFESVRLFNKKLKRIETQICIDSEDVDDSDNSNHDYDDDDSDSDGSDIESNINSSDLEGIDSSSESETICNIAYQINESFRYRLDKLAKQMKKHIDEEMNGEVLDAIAGQMNNDQHLKFSVREEPTKHKKKREQKAEAKEAEELEISEVKKKGKGKKHKAKLDEIIDNYFYKVNQKSESSDDAVENGEEE